MPPSQGVEPLPPTEEPLPLAVALARAPLVGAAEASTGARAPQPSAPESSPEEPPVPQLPAQGPPLPARVVPRQDRDSHDAPADRARVVGVDPLDDPDPQIASDGAGVENLLRCWVRESGLARPDGDTLRIPLAASGTVLLVPVRYWSPTGWHRFGPPLLEHGPHDAPAVGAVTLAALLTREAAYSARRDDPDADATELVARVADSVRRTALFLAHRRAAPADPGTSTPFLNAEQSLLFGHPLHPTPKTGPARAVLPRPGRMTRVSTCSSAGSAIVAVAWGRPCSARPPISSSSTVRPAPASWPNRIFATPPPSPPSSAPDSASPRKSNSPANAPR
ncbi:hypothetical protein SANTM175S_04626 [Streptomyces antimycoticus]